MANQYQFNEDMRLEVPLREQLISVLRRDEVHDVQKL